MSTERFDNPVTDHYNVYQLFQTALATRRGPVHGVLHTDNDGACARFEVEWNSGVIAAIRYQCTTCITLVALCELTQATAAGMSASEAFQVDATWLLRHLPEIPAAKHSRALLASRAFRAALSIE